jgi:hypothetical protein
MFHVDVTLEDTRIIGVQRAFPAAPDDMVVTFADNVTGKQFVRSMPLATLGRILFIGLAGIDCAYVPGFSYASVEAEFADCPNECRPIP